MTWIPTSVLFSPCDEPLGIGGPSDASGEWGQWFSYHPYRPAAGEIVPPLAFLVSFRDPPLAESHPRFWRTWAPSNIAAQKVPNS